jgi:hypothetical protein
MKHLPDALVAYHRAGLPLEGQLDSVRLRRYQLWPLAQVEKLNDSYAVREFAPGYIGIGSDGGGEMIARAPSGEIVMMPFVGMEPEEAVVLAPSWQEFVSRIKPGGA